jgi:hypothetical protein
LPERPEGCFAQRCLTPFQTAAKLFELMLNSPFLQPVLKRGFRLPVSFLRGPRGVGRRIDAGTFLNLIVKKRRHFESASRWSPSALLGSLLIHG